MSGGKRGFTLIEALVAVVLAGIGVAAALQGIASLTKAQAKSVERELMMRLADEKLHELIATGDTTNVGGTFEDQGEDRYTWEAASDTVGVENLSQITVTVRLQNQTRQAEESVSTLVYEPPQTSGGTP